MSHHFSGHFEEACRPQPHFENQHHQYDRHSFIDHCDRGNQHIFHHYHERFPRCHNDLPAVVIILNNDRERLWERPRCYERPMRGASFFVRNPGTDYDYETNDFRPSQVRERQLEEQWGTEGSAGYDPNDNAPRQDVGAFSNLENPATPYGVRDQARTEARGDSPEDLARRRAQELDAQWGPEGSAGYNPNDNAPRERVGAFERPPADYLEFKAMSFNSSAEMARYIAARRPVATYDNF